MNLGLDLSQSEAKLARARVHLEALKREIEVVVSKRDFYTAETEPDPDSQYWHYVVFVPKPRDDPPIEYSLGVIFGDVIHNLRSALDYIVTALVKASPSATIGNKHQFPIFESRTGYEDRVGDDTTVKPGKMLGGVTHGIREIWDLQPFHRDPKMATSLPPGHDIVAGYPLAQIRRFSDADKHRLMAAIVPKIEEVDVIANRPDAIAEKRQLDLSDWEPNVKRKVMKVLIRIGLDKVQLQAKAPVVVHFGTSTFPKGGSGYAVNVLMVEEMCETVSGIIDLFKSL